MKTRGSGSYSLDNGRDGLLNFSGSGGFLDICGGGSERGSCGIWAAVNVRLS